MNSIISSIKMLLIMTILTGIIYPLFITAIGQICFFEKANGSIRFVNEQPVGSDLIGQNFYSEKYFHGRPSACNYDTIGAGASNKSVTNKEYSDLVNKTYNNLCNTYNIKEIPQELYTSSGSGLDPEISQKAALIQIDRVALARNMSKAQKEQLKMLVIKMTEKRTFGILGEERINVLKLNLAVDLIK